MIPRKLRSQGLKLKLRFNKHKNKDMYGLNQGRFNRIDAPLFNNLGIRKIWKYKSKPDRVTSMSSGSVILSLGLSIGFSISATTNISTLTFGNPLLTITSNSVGGLFTQFTLIFITIFSNPITLLPSLSLGWFLGGLTAGFVYKREGRNGPIYSSYLLITIVISFSFFLSLLSMNVQDSSNLSEMFGNIQLLMILMVLLGLLSLPLILVAWLGYKLVMVFSR